MRPCKRLALATLDDACEHLKSVSPIGTPCRRRIQEVLARHLYRGQQDIVCKSAAVV